MTESRTAPETERAGAGADLSVSGLRFGYGQDGFRLVVPELRIPAGQRAVLIGPSGSGKTTLLHLLAGILTPDAGTIKIGAEELTAKSDADRRRYRIGSIGLIFQEFELLDHLTVLENILLPYYVNRALTLDSAVATRAGELAAGVGISGLAGRRPRSLSQGERQRVAICRALVTQPRVVMADEPTGNVDPETTRAILHVIFEQVAAQGATLLMVTHDHSLVESFDQVVDFSTFGGPDGGEDGG